MKTCSKCGQSKPRTEYYSANKKTKPEQLMAACKECSCALKKQYTQRSDNSKEMYIYSDEFGYQLKPGVIQCYSNGPWPFCGFCRVRRADNANANLKREDETVAFKYDNRRRIVRGKVETMHGIPICRDCLVGEFHGPTTANEWAYCHGGISNMKRATEENADEKINWHEFRRDIDRAIIKNGWDKIELHRWYGRSITEANGTAREREAVKDA